MTDFWIVVAAVGAATALCKAAGPVTLGRRPLPVRWEAVVELLAPAMLIALVVAQTFGGDGGVTVDARLPGVAAAAVAVWRRVPIILAMVVAGAVTAAVRLAA